MRLEVVNRFERRMRFMYQLQQREMRTRITFTFYCHQSSQHFIYKVWFSRYTFYHAYAPPCSGWIRHSSHPNSTHVLIPILTRDGGWRAVVVTVTVGVYVTTATVVLVNVAVEVNIDTLPSSISRSAEAETVIVVKLYGMVE